MKTTFVKEIVENWLTSLAEEKGGNIFTLTTLVIKYLLSEGYTILRFHGGAGEKGKDIIAKNGDTYYKFQLKQGDIKTKDWDGGIYSQVEKMIYTKASEIPSNALVENIIITNGEITNDVKETIREYNQNQAKWQNSPLEIWDKGVLIEKLAGKIIIPFNKNNILFHQFGKIYFDLQFKGDDIADIKILDKFLHSVLPVEKWGGTKEFKKDIYATILIFHYFVSAFEKKNNYTEVIKIYTLLVSYCLGIFEKLNLNDKQLNYLIEEVFKEELFYNSKQMLENDYEIIKNLTDKENTDLTFYVNKFRIQNFIKIGLAYKLNDQEISQEVEKFLKEQPIHLFSESAFLIQIFRYLMTRNINYLNDSIYQIILHNHKNKINKTNFILPPYYSDDEIISYKLGLSDWANIVTELEISRVRKDGISYFLKTIIELIIDNGNTEYLEKDKFFKDLEGWSVWSFVSEFENARYYSEEDWRYLFLKNNMDSGYMLFENWDRGESSKNKILEDANSINIPEIFTRFKFIIPYYLVLMPYRINYKLLKTF